MRTRFASTVAMGMLAAMAAPLSSQATGGHVYWVGFFQALPGKAAAYNRVLTEVAAPVLDELVKRGQMVSHVQLARSGDGGEYTNLVILEFPDQAALDRYEARLNDASLAVLHKSWQDAVAAFGEVRRLVRIEYYAPAAGRQ